ncbi:MULTISPECIES: acyl-CoA-binding protein [Corallincola]|uniref:Acyl-CoA-binding protein n=3 Tax=Corallincola TaxID=1775176 RepID=A0A368NSR7_9GAMM|nr:MULTISPECIES: acyl-CoA-binding protein [Corallincola]RCU52865.1 acyl-CoA-binding protein [Corallincola holothuriorum]TAA47982.1 acyl-CoA-binding protein [Corallincola spongiicola]TCI03364.1 acyl-CoA-binding protein [Corallincola luteus]
MADSNLFDLFEQAQNDVRLLPHRPVDEDLLELYALFKQATEGDVNGPRPAFFDFRACAKHEAREHIKGLDKDAAMDRYCRVVTRLKSELAA